MRNARNRRLVTAVALAAVAALAACSAETPVDNSTIGTTPTATEEATTIEPAASEDPTGEATTEEAVEEAPIAIAEVGWTTDPDEIIATGWAVVDNPTSDMAALNVSWVAYDADDNVVSTAESAYIILRSDRDAVVTGSFTDAANIERVEATMAVEESQADERPESTFTAVKLNPIIGDYDFRLTGVVESTYAQTVNYVLLSAICRDETGKVTAAGETWIDGWVTPGEQTPFETYMWGAGSTDCTVSVSVTNISEAK